MSDAQEGPVVTYECPIAGTEHPLPGDDTRIMMTGDAGFVVACDCGPEALEEADEKPHQTVDHLVNIYANDPSPSQWLRLEAAADGWYATTAFDTPEEYDGTHGQRRQQVRERAEKLADEKPNGEPTSREVAAREAVACPQCDASAGSKCQRPSGHSVRTVHAARVEAAEASGAIEATSGDALDTEAALCEQAELEVFGA
jgi:hypothetical protein